LYSGESRKDQYWTLGEQVKFYSFKVPKGDFWAQINVRALTEDYYPEIYLQYNDLSANPASFYKGLTYPTAGSDRKDVIVFGESFFDLVHNQNVRNYILS
jgi:hypothetical protein